MVSLREIDLIAAVLSRGSPCWLQPSNVRRNPKQDVMFSSCGMRMIFPLEMDEFSKARSFMHRSCSYYLVRHRSDGRTSDPYLRSLQLV